MQSITYLIVDDEPPARLLLKTYLDELPHFQLVKLCANVMEAYEMIQTNKVDLLFLDIKMPLVSGVEFLRSLKNPPKVIFTTAYNKYAMDGYELNVLDYLLKPISRPRLFQALDKVQERMELQAVRDKSENPKHLFVKADNRFIKIDLVDILLIEGLQNYVKIHLTSQIIVTAYTMKAMTEMLPARDFLRVHRSFIIAVRIIQSIHGNTIETGYQNVPIGLNYRNEVLQLVGKL